MPGTSVTAKLDVAAIEAVSMAARSEIVRTLAFEMLRRSGENVTEMRAIDTGELKGSGHVQLGADGTVPGLGEDEAIVAYSAAHAEAVHEGLGSNRRIGPRPFLHKAAEDLQDDADRIAADIVRRNGG